MNKPIQAPSLIHSEKGDGFHSFFKEQCKKIEFSHNRVAAVSTPYLPSVLFWKNYDDINWGSAKKKMTKML